MLPGHKVCDAPVRCTGYLCHDRIAVEAKERHRSRQDAGPLIVRFVEQFLRRCRHDGVDTFVTKMPGGLHPVQRRLDPAARIGKERCDPGERFVLLGIKHVKDRADKQSVAGLFPVVALLEAAFRIDQHVGDILHVAHFPFAAPDLEQRIVGGGSGIGRIKQQDPAMASAEACRNLPVLALDVVNDRRSRPGQQRWNDQTDTFTRPCGREAKDMFRAVMTQIRSAKPAEDYAGITEHAHFTDFTFIGPAGRAEGFRLAAFARPPD